MDLKQECEKTFYRELYHFEDEAQQLLMDETTRKLYLRKEKQFYDLQVYRYLKEHACPQLANVHDFWEEDGRLIVIEEYIEGGTLDTQLQKEGTLPEEEALRILKEICKGLSFLHRATPQIVHRDLKASNVMLTKDGAVKLIDYDAAKTVKEGAGKDTVLIGTEGNAAPEQYGFAQSDGRTDIYALGILMKRLFPDTSHYAHIIQKATQMDPVNRYQTVEELLSDVDAAHHAREDMPGSSGTTATIPKEASSAGESHGRSQTSHKRIIIPLLCALLLIGIAAAVLLPRVFSRQEGAGVSADEASSAGIIDSEKSEDTNAETESPVTTDNKKNSIEYGEFLKEYEEYVDEYAAFMKKYKENPNDVQLTLDYADYLLKFSERIKEIDTVDTSQLSSEDLETYKRIIMKLNSISY